MVYPPFWLWLLAFALLFGGLWLSDSLPGDRMLTRLPRWFCALLALASLIGMWYLLNAQFGGHVVRLALP